MFIPALIPCRLSAQLYMRANRLVEKRVEPLSYETLIIATSAALLSFSYASVVFKEVEADLILYVSVYTLLLVINGYFGIALRVLFRSDLMLKISILDFFITLLQLATYVYIHSIEVLCSFFIVRELVKIFMFFRLAPTPFNMHYFKPFDFVFGNRRVHFFTKIHSLFHINRSLIQLIFQQQDRIIFPLIFGTSTAGHVFIGTSLGAVFSMVSSSLFTWLLPSSKNDYLARNSLHKQIFLLSCLSFILVAAGFLLHFYTKSTGIEVLSERFKIEFILVGFLYSSSVPILFPLLLKWNSNVFRIGVTLLMVIVFLTIDLVMGGVYLSLGSGIISCLVGVFVIYGLAFYYADFTAHQKLTLWILFLIMSGISLFATF
ncbi:hypothetical protein [Pseudidiomarina sp. CB1]|uniref:hypothetical protein n=1 Tax=Pseudidiomarina sp. CB1 TaxID=2972484 RepID=UPI0021633439|nr:hypothetical protein [Pseudidiomarina sp. CB1]